MWCEPGVTDGGQELHLRMRLPGRVGGTARAHTRMHVALAVPLARCSWRISMTACCTS